MPLTECLDSYFVAAEIPRRVPAAAAPDAVLDQLPTADLTVRRTPLIEMLRPAYRALAPQQPAAYRS